MKCPICNHEMKEGVVQSGRTIFFTTEPHKFFFTPDIAVGEEITLNQHKLDTPDLQGVSLREV